MSDDRDDREYRRIYPRKRRTPPPPPPAEVPPPAPETPTSTVPDSSTASPANGRIVVDPITRIEGHLKIETEVAGGKVSGAWSTGTLFRGIETILKGRNPEDAWLFTQRICGVCTYVHGASSVRSVEDAARPLEILRTVHSLDPCIACAVHVIDPENDRAYEIKVL